MDNQGSHGDANGHHQHDSWPAPPERYATLACDKWEDKTLADKGRMIYQKNCIACHGDTGKGDGILAAGLPHPPADLSNHFHTAPGTGDGYLFWRTSEGGTAEPIKSMQSTMPAFAQVLSVEERWSVLTYVHQAFHGGFGITPIESHDSAHSH